MGLLVEFLWERTFRLLQSRLQEGVGALGKSSAYRLAVNIGFICCGAAALLGQRLFVY